MEPLSILSLAACTAQFIDFGCKLFSQSFQLYHHGSSFSITHLAKVTDDLSIINDDLDRRCLSEKPRDAEELALYRISKECSTIAIELLQVLKVLAGKDNQHNAWTSFRTALRTVWRKSQIEELEQRLAQYRQQLTLRVVVVLNSKLDAVLAQGDKIVEVVSLNFEDMRTKLTADATNYRDALRQSDDEASRRHAETLAAILTTRGGQSHAITAPEYIENACDQPTLADASQTTITYKLPGISSPKCGDDTLAVDTAPRLGLVEQIIDALHYRQILDRETAISPAHKHTFDWVLNKSDGTAGWDDLVTWLESGTGCYWVTGKAGSGKSTLMKYVQQDSRTLDALREWAGDSELVTGSFYFWYAGSSLQKSQTGLLRALLYTILSQHPAFCLQLFPDLYRSLLGRKGDGVIDISFHELLRAFQTFTNNVPKNLKVALFIDGLDEYHGVHNEICEVFLQATRSDSLKIMVSSRPIPSCISSLSSCPKLELQQLTRGDIERYVGDRLSSHTLMKRKEVGEPGVTESISSAIMAKASGVFLWVVLVIKMVLIGVEDHDTPEDLLQLIEELPPDLEKLYDHMLGSMKPKHRVESSKMLQLVLRSMRTHGEYPMTPLQLYFAQHKQSGIRLPHEVPTLTQHQTTWAIEDIEGRMRSRCCGLIEVFQDKTSHGESFQKVVGFHHRTVVEFLQLDAVWAKLSSETRTTGFDVDKALFNSALSEMKTTILSKGQSNSGGVTSAINSILRMFTYEQNMEDSSFLKEHGYFEEMERALRELRDLLSNTQSLATGCQEILAINSMLMLFSISCHRRVAKSDRALIATFAQHGGIQDRETSTQHVDV